MRDAGEARGFLAKGDAMRRDAAGDDAMLRNEAAAWSCTQRRRRLMHSLCQRRRVSLSSARVLLRPLPGMNSRPCAALTHAHHDTNTRRCSEAANTGEGVRGSAPLL